MYVLLDMEWVTDSRGSHWPTQLSAIRVNRLWQTEDCFSTLFRPQNAAFRQWEHIAFTGWLPADFLRAPALYPAMDAFVRWLQPDDILCWWHQKASSLFSLFQKAAQIPDRAAQALYLNKSVAHFLAGQPDAFGSPYKLCAARGIAVPGPAHCADSDVRTIQLLLQGIRFPEDALFSAPPEPKPSVFPTAAKGSDTFSLLYDREAALLHYSNCERLPDGQLLPAFSSFPVPLRKRYKPCPCCREEYRDALRARNRDSIARSEYNYIFSRQSGVFHRKDCFHILLFKEIQGTISYDSCIKTGRRPCRHCNPVRIEKQAEVRPERSAAAPVAGGGSALSSSELRAIGRFKQAKEERTAALRKGSLTEGERQNAMALSQPGLAFWASRGYRTFHCRNCAKIAGLDQLRGFPRYQDAVRAGYVPCRQCRPSPRQDAAFSIPITNEERSGESTQTLVRLCTEHCLPFEYNDQFFTMQTMAGKWRIDTSRRPVHLEHINLVIEPENTNRYHIQPRLFLSLRDTFDYIMQHDSTLIERMLASERESQSAVG